ncbi:Conidiation protein 6-domain-containing protein [Trametes punicea]|nr:Conidiation protein 6-domain-containing protein [Trametes punicea]
MFTAPLTTARSALRPSAGAALRAYATSTSGHPNENRVAGGLKASLHNPRVSQEAKERAAERLEEMGETSLSAGSTKGASQHKNHVLGGYKATLHNPYTSEEAKRHAREILEADSYQLDPPKGVSADEHEKRVLAGYKAALHNPRVSKEAKRHAQEYLKEHNAL